MKTSTPGPWSNVVYRGPKIYVSFNILKYEARVPSFLYWSTDIKSAKVSHDHNDASRKWIMKIEMMDTFLCPKTGRDIALSSTDLHEENRVKVSRFEVPVVEVSSFSHRYFKFLLRNWHFPLNLIFWIKVIGLWLIVLSLFGHRCVVTNHSPKICITSQIYI